MATDKASSKLRTKSNVSRDPVAISEDISRIVGYLNTKRSNASELTSGLAQEISHRREDLSGQSGHDVNSDALTQADMRKGMAGVQSTSRTKSNPALAERYHAFCHELDVMLDGFRARVDGDKPVKH